ncbi:hypothetical protein FRC07_007309 [Ceratobasidium sp. 392]|nr:hypothetical protein FRC07_007309 [Ceratobasidium sp. 392]
MAANTMPSHHSNKDGLRLSLQRLGYRLKNLFRPSPSQYSLDADQPLSTLHPDSPLPTKAPEPGQTSNSSDPSVTRPATEVNPVKAIGNITWAGLGNSLQILVQSSGLFPPLRAVAGDLLETLDVFQAAAKSREDYNELALELSTVINDVANYLAESKSVQISESLMRVVDGLEKQIKHIHERQRRGAAKRYVEAADDIDDLIVCYRRIDALFRQLQNTRLEGIHPAKQAWYNAGGSGQVRRRGCTPNTRQAILEKLWQWAHAHTDPKVYWMNGMAGTGKKR